MSKALATKKVAAALLGFGMVLAFAGVASAQTTTSASTLATLQAQVQALLAQIAALQGTGTATTGSTSGACFTFTQNESQGASGGQVMWVQEFLNGHGYTVAASGAGSPGNETSYYGALTAAAVTAFQNAYAAQILTPVGLTSGTGYWGPSTRAEANALCAGSTSTGTGTGTTSTGPGITVSAAAQPANSLAPENATRVPFTTFTLTNNTSAAVTINSIQVQRTGLAQDAAFAGVVLVDPNGLQIGVSRTFDSNHQAAIGTPFTLNAGQSETFTVAGNMAADESAYAGEVAAISVIGVNTSVPVAGSLPITGAQQTINASLTIGSATAQVSSYDPNTYRTEPIGTTGLIFSGIRITAGSAEDEKLYSITWNQTGSIGSGDLANLVTVVNGTSYPITVDSTGKYFTSTFPGGILIPKGNTVDAYIQGDITGNDASGRTVEFDIYRQSDVYLVGQTYGYGVTVTPTVTNTFNSQSSTSDVSQFVGTGGGTSAGTVGSPFFEGSLTLVQPGTLSTVGNAGSIGSQNIGINVPNQPLGGFTTNFTGEPVSVQTLTFDVSSTTSGGTGNLTNVSIVDQNGNVVAGPVDESSVANGGVGLTFNTSVTFPVGPMTYTLKGTVPSTAGNGTTYQLSFNPGNWTGAQGETSGANVTLPPTTITMSTMTVQSASLVISAASTPASTTVAPGASNFVIANINLDASQSGEDVRINSLPIVILDASTTATDAANYLKNSLSNCQLWNGSTALNSQSVGSSNWSTANAYGATGGALESNFVFQNSLTIPKGTVVTLSLECNVSSSILAGSEFSAGVNSGLFTTSSATGVQSGIGFTPTTSTGNSVSGTMTVGTANLTVSIPTPVSYSQVSGGSTAVTVGTFTLQPTSDSVNLQNIALALNSNFASSSDVSRAYIYNGSTQVGTVIFTGSPIADASVGDGNYYIATTSVSSLNLPQNVQTTLTIKADVNQIGLGQAANSGHEIKIGLSNAQGTGSSSGTPVNSDAVGNSDSVSGVAIFRSYPVVAASSYLPSNGVADGRLIAFSVTANSNGPVGLTQLLFSISTTSINSLTGLELYAYTDSGFSQPAGGTTNGGQVGTTAYDGTTQYATTTASTPLEIPAGTTEYFILKGTVSPGNSTSYNIATTLLGDSTDLAPVMSVASTLTGANAHFVWSPNSTTTTPTVNADWTNGYGVSGLPASGIVQNRTQ